MEQLISSLREDWAHNTISVFPACVAQPDPPLLAPWQCQWVREEAQAEGVCEAQGLIQDHGAFVWKGTYSSKYMKAGSRFVTSFTVLPTTYNCYMSLVTSPQGGRVAWASISQS